LGRWLLVACFSSVKNHNVSGSHLFPSFTTCQKNPFATPRTVLQRAKKSLCNRSQFRTLFLPHRFIKIRPSHQRPVSIEFLTICPNPEFPKSEPNQKSRGNVRIWRKRAAIRRKNHSNLNKNFEMNLRINCSTFWCKHHIIIYRWCDLTKINICIVWRLFEQKSTQSKAPVSTTNVSWHHYITWFLKSMILYGEVVAKNEINSRMKMSQNLQNLATVCIKVIFSQIWSQGMHW